MDGARQEHVDDDRAGDEQHGQGWQRPDAARSEVRIGEARGVEGLFARIDEDEAADAEHGAQRDDEGIDAGLPHDQPVEAAEQRAAQQAGENGHQKHPVAKEGQRFPSLHVDRDCGGERQDGANRQVDVAVDHHQGQPESDQADGGGLDQDVLDILQGEEMVGGKAEEDKDDDHETPDRVSGEPADEAVVLYVAHRVVTFRQSATRANGAWTPRRARRSG